MFDVLSYKRVKQEIVISETDVQMALNHLQNLPYSRTAGMPESWGREWVLQCIRDELDKQQGKVMDQQCFSFGPSLWAMVVPFGVDLLGVCSENRLQVWVMKRDVGTDPDRITKL